MNTPIKLTTALILLTMVSACQTAIPSVTAEAPTTYEYTQASRSGLKTLRPYPNPDDVCKLLKVNKAVEDLVVEGRTLFACPKHETGAIGDRRRAALEAAAYLNSKAAALNRRSLDSLRPIPHSQNHL